MKLKSLLIASLLAVTGALSTYGISLNGIELPTSYGMEPERSEDAMMDVQQVLLDKINQIDPSKPDEALVKLKEVAQHPVAADLITTGGLNDLKLRIAELEELNKKVKEEGSGLLSDAPWWLGVRSADEKNLYQWIRELKVNLLIQLR